jgi:putative endonuclease
MYSEKRKLGNIGEDVAVEKLKNKGFVILSRNYLKKWGEIDIVARGTDGLIHFVEVKSVSRGTFSNNKGASVSYETFRPEENVTREKLVRLQRVIQSWLVEHKYEGEWQIDVASVTLDMTRRVGRVEMLWRVY